MALLLEQPLNMSFLTIKNSDWYRCSECNALIYTTDIVNYHYCPYCGVKIDAYTRLGSKTGEQSPVSTK